MTIRRRLPLFFVSLAFAFAALLSAAPLLAQDATPAPGVTVLPPDAEVEGLGVDDWLVRSWQLAVSYPNDVSPWLDETGDRCGYGQAGSVFILPGTFLPEPPDEVTCVVAEGLTIYVPVGSAECSTVEPPPFFGRDEAELLACAEAFVLPVADIGLEATINGTPVADLEQYRAATSLFPMTFPEINAFGVPAGVANAVAVGYGFFLAPLPVGEHEIRFSTAALGPDGTSLPDFVFRVVVAEPTIIEPVATPEASPAA